MDGTMLLPLFRGLMLYTHLMTSELPDPVSLSGPFHYGGGGTLFPRGLLCVALLCEVPSQKQPSQRPLCLARTVRSTPAVLYCLSCFLALQCPSGIPCRVHLCAFNSVLLLNCKILEGRVCHSPCCVPWWHIVRP